MTPWIIISNKRLNILMSPQVTSAVTPAQRQLQCLTALMLQGRESRSPAEIRKTFPPAANSTRSHCKENLHPVLCSSWTLQILTAALSLLLTGCTRVRWVLPSGGPACKTSMDLLHPRRPLVLEPKGKCSSSTHPLCLGDAGGWCRMLPGMHSRGGAVFSLARGVCSCLGRYRFGKGGGRRC